MEVNTIYFEEETPYGSMILIINHYTQKMRGETLATVPLGEEDKTQWVSAALRNPPVYDFDIHRNQSMTLRRSLPDSRQELRVLSWNS